MLDMAAHFDALLAHKRREPADDLASQLLQAEREGHLRGGAELLAQCAMLLFAGDPTEPRKNHALALEVERRLRERGRDVRLVSFHGHE